MDTLSVFLVGCVVLVTLLVAAALFSAVAVHLRISQQRRLASRSWGQKETFNHCLHQVLSLKTATSDYHHRPSSVRSSDDSPISVAISERAMQAARLVRSVARRNAASRSAKVAAFEGRIRWWVQRRKQPAFSPMQRIRRPIARPPRLAPLDEDPREEEAICGHGDSFDQLMQSLC